MIVLPAFASFGQSPEQGEPPFWKIKIVKGRSSEEKSIPDNIKIYSKATGDLLVDYTPVDASFYEKATPFRLKDFPRPLLMTGWNHGANGISLKIFDPSTKNPLPLYEGYFKSYVEYDVEGDHLVITEFRQLHKDEEPVEVKKFWKPQGL